jgi:transcriptional regulator with XRE-family HTH domain
VDRLARESGVHRATIYRWKNGGVTNVTVESVKAVARALGDNESDALLAAGDAVTRPAGPRALTNLGHFVLSSMVRLGLSKPEELAELSGLSVDQITTVMFTPDVVVDPTTFDRLADALGVEMQALDAASAGAVPPPAAPAPQRDEDVTELAAMLSVDSPLSESEQRNLRALVGAAMQPYREKYADVLGDRRAC